MAYRTVTFTLIFMMFFTPVCKACLWDYDTLAMERLAFPGIHELIVGHFVRHSSAYYRWRIDDRSSTPEEARTPADYDDIAVAHDKLGEHEKAIEIIKAKIKRWPNEFRYESEANLGTFLIHSGDLKTGLVHIKKAIEINPDAHFGREIYQQRLVEFILENQSGKDQISFYRFLSTDENGKWRHLDKAEVEKAIKGVAGMMRFGNYDSPVLLSALASLLRRDSDSNMVACRAYLMASYETDDKILAAEFRMLADKSVGMQVSHNLERVEKELKEEIAQAEALFAQIESDEIAWAESGLNLDEKFKAKYYDAPPLKLAPSNYLRSNIYVLAGGVGVLLIACGLFVAYRSLIDSNAPRTIAELQHK